MGGLFDEQERARIGAALDEQVPGAADLGAVDYVECLLTALDHDPPRIWAGPDGWLAAGPWERHAWERRIDELRAVYRRVLDGALAQGDDRALHAHACEATYGDPAYHGNRSSGGWQRIAFPEPLFPPSRGDGPEGASAGSAPRDGDSTAGVGSASEQPARDGPEGAS